MVQINFAKRLILLKVVVCGSEAGLTTGVAAGLRRSKDLQVRVPVLERAGGMNTEAVVVGWDEPELGSRDVAIMGADAVLLVGPATTDDALRVWSEARERFLAQGLDLRVMPRVALLGGLGHPGAATVEDVRRAVGDPELRVLADVLRPADALFQGASAQDDALLRDLGPRVHVGRAFAFLPREAFQSPRVVATLRGLGLPAPTGPKVTPLAGGGPVDVAGARVIPLALPRVKLVSLTSDKLVYREGEPVRLLVVDPLGPGRDLDLVTARNGAPFARTRVRLDRRGVHATALRDLPGGRTASRSTATTRRRSRSRSRSSRSRRSGPSCSSARSRARRSRSRRAWTRSASRSRARCASPCARAAAT